MTAVCIVAGVLIIWCAVSVTPALLIGRAIHLRDTRETPTPGVLGEAAPGRRAHLWLVR